MTTMRIRYKKLGGHFHCRVFTAPARHLTFAKCGELVFDEREWNNIRDILSNAEFIDDDRHEDQCK